MKVTGTKNHNKKGCFGPSFGTGCVISRCTRSTKRKSAPIEASAGIFSISISMNPA